MEETREKGHKTMSRTKPWELSDKVWERAKPLIPLREGKKKTGRPPLVAGCGVLCPVVGIWVAGV